MAILEKVNNNMYLSQHDLDNLLTELTVLTQPKKSISNSYS